MDVACFSHTLDHVGEQMNTPILDELYKAWIGMLSHSPKTRLIWRLKTGLPVPSYSTTRWWSHFEVFDQFLSTFGDVPTFLENEDLAPSNSSKLHEILSHPAKCRKLKMKLAVTVDAMKPFVKATYYLGDGVLAFHAYECLSLLFSSVSNPHYPNVVSVAKDLANGSSSHEQQLVAYAKSCVQPTYAYFHRKFEHDLKTVLDAFKAARYFFPSQINEIKPIIDDIDSLNVECLGMHA